MPTILWTITDKTKLIKKVSSGKIYKYLYVLCVCKCSTESWVRKDSLLKDSFGCKKCMNAARTHGQSGSQLYNSWSGMRQRCSYSKHIGYENYGGRGIKVCKEWNNSFYKFAKWAKRNGYKPGLTIERINSKGNYEPGNCCWKSRAGQSRNTGRNIFFEKDGKRMVLKDWCKELNVNYGSVRDRLYRGIKIEAALLDPGLGVFKERKHKQGRRK